MDLTRQAIAGRLAEIVDPTMRRTTFFPNNRLSPAAQRSLECCRKTIRNA